MLDWRLIRYFDPDEHYALSDPPPWSRPMRGQEPDERELRWMILDALLDDEGRFYISPPEYPGTTAGLYSCGPYWVFVRMEDLGDGWLEPSRVDVRAYRYPRPYAFQNDPPPINSTRPMRQLPLAQIFADLREHYAQLLKTRVAAAPIDAEIDEIPVSEEWVEAVLQQHTAKDAVRRLETPVKGQLGRPRLSDEFLQGVADAYRKARKGDPDKLAETPRKAVKAYARQEMDDYANAPGDSPTWSTVDRWIAEASTRGFLEPPPSKGKARGRPKGR